MPQDSEIAALAVALTQMQGDAPSAATDESGPKPTPRTMTALRHAAILSETPVREEGSALRLDAHLPRWLPRNCNCN